MTKETVERWKLEKRIPNDESAATRGYTYRDQTSGEDMIEFHVDDFDFLHSEADEMGFGAAGGNLSIRKPPNTKPLMKSGKQLRERQQACCTHLASYRTPDESIQDTQSCSGLRCRFREQRCICCNRERCGGEELSCRGPIVVVF